MGQVPFPNSSATGRTWRGALLTIIPLPFRCLCTCLKFSRSSEKILKCKTSVNPGAVVATDKKESENICDNQMVSTAYLLGRFHCN